MNIRSIPPIVSLLSVLLSHPLVADDKPNKVAIPQKSKVESLKKAPTVAPQVKPQKTKEPNKSTPPSKPRLDLKKISPQKVQPTIKPSLTKPTNLKPTVNKPATAKPGSAKTAGAKMPSPPKSTNLPTKPKPEAMKTRPSVAKVLGPKPSVKTSGLLPTKNLDKKTASIPSPKKADPTLKTKAPGTSEKPVLTTKKTSLPKPQNLPGKTLQAQATPKPASTLAVQTSTDLKINKEDLGQSARSLGDRVVDRESLGQRSGVDLTGSQSLGERSGVGGASQSGVKDRVSEQLGVNPGKLAGLGRADVLQDNNSSPYTVNEIVETKGTRATGSRSLADISNDVGQNFTVIISERSEINPAGRTETSGESSGKIVIDHVRAKGDNRSAEQLSRDLVSDYERNAIATAQDDSSLTGELYRQEEERKGENDRQNATQDAANAWGSTTTDSAEANSGTYDQGNTVLVDESTDEDGNTVMTFAPADDSNDSGEASPEATPEPDSDQRTADGDTPRGRGQEDPNKVAVAMEGGGRGTIRTGNDTPRSGVSQTQSSSDSDTVRIDPDRVRSGEVSDVQLARIAQESNPEAGQGGQDGGRDGLDLPKPQGGLAGGPVVNPPGGGADPSTLRNGSTGPNLLKGIQQENLQLNTDALQNVQPVKK